MIVGQDYTKTWGLQDLTHLFRFLESRESSKIVASFRDPRLEIHRQAAIFPALFINPTPRLYDPGKMNRRVSSCQKHHLALLFHCNGKRVSNGDSIDRIICERLQI